MDPSVWEITAESMTDALEGHLPGMAPDVRIRPVTGDGHDAWVETQLQRPHTHAVVWIERAEDAGLLIGLRFPGARSTWSRRLPEADDPAVVEEALAKLP